jgi:excinuclease ABC subunit C
MQQSAEAWNFERAAEVRDRIDAVKHVLQRQKVVSADNTNADVIAVAQGPGGDAGVQVSFLRNGKLLGSEFFPMSARIEDEPAELISGFVSQFYTEAALIPARLVLQHALPEADEAVITEWLRERRGGKIEIVVPQRGQRKALVEMVAKSASDNLEQNRVKFLSDEMRMTAALDELSDALDLPRLPRRIECFDISHIQGTNKVASMVVFEDGRPAKKEYRRFNIKTVEGSDDFASMNEVIKRRFKRAAERDEETEGKWTTLPDFVIIDGGKGQLNAALAAMQETGLNVPMAGLAKENEELFLPGQPIPVILPRDSQALYLVQRVRDEAHRFAVTFHRQKRSKQTFTSSLDTIPGIGPKKKKALMKQFGSVAAIRAASEEELIMVDGINAALAAQIKASL